MCAALLAMSACRGSFEWEEASPASQGLREASLEQLWEGLVPFQTRALLVIRNDRILFERYAAPAHENTLFSVASVSKGTVGALGVLAAVDEGLIRIEDPVHRYVPRWIGIPGKQDITIAQLLKHTSGLEDSEEGGAPHSELTGWKGEFWSYGRDPRRGHIPYLHARDKAKLLFPPGTRAHYSNPGYAMLGLALAKSLKRSRYFDLGHLLRDRVMEPLGVGAHEWELNRDLISEYNGLRLVMPWGGARYTARTLAKLGRLLLREGDWDGKRVLSKSALSLALTDTGDPAGKRRPGVPQWVPGLGFSLNTMRQLGRLPSDAFASMGANHQVLLVVPSQELIVVRLGRAWLRDPDGGNKHAGLVRYLSDPLMNAIETENAPIPAGPAASALPVGTERAVLCWPARAGTLTEMRSGKKFARGSLSGNPLRPVRRALIDDGEANAVRAEAQFEVDLPLAGDWYLWARLLNPGVKHNPEFAPDSFWAQLDSHDQRVLGNMPGDWETWQWRGTGPHPLLLATAQAGPHTLRIKNREVAVDLPADAAPRIDVLLLTNDPRYEPADEDCLPQLDARIPAAAPVPQSQQIRGITWDEPASVRRFGRHADNWPATAAGEGVLYTAYGDGWAFDDSESAPKLSLGFARLSGSPPHISGINLSSPSGEDRGDGTRGKKASSLLMVDDVLYMWVRNAAANGRAATLAWSADRAATWNWVDWRFDELGYPAFIQYGANYSGARDDYVYSVSPDGPSAYEPADRMLLLRVPREKIRDKGAYEFFAGFDGHEAPRWTNRFDQREGVFAFSGNCARSSVSYNEGLGRYLWWQQIPSGLGGVDTRYVGGLGIYEAPEPWGPWRSVTYVRRWDMAPGETATFPTPWMRDGGRRAYLLFSGDGVMSLRGATFELP